MSNISASESPSGRVSLGWLLVILVLVCSVAVILEALFLSSAVSKIREFGTSSSVQKADLYSQATTLLLGQLALVTASVGLSGALFGLRWGNLGKGFAVVAGVLAVVGAGMTCWIASKF